MGTGKGRSGKNSTFRPLLEIGAESSAAVVGRVQGWWSADVALAVTWVLVGRLQTRQLHGASRYLVMPGTRPTLYKW